MEKVRYQIDGTIERDRKVEGRQSRENRKELEMRLQMGNDDERVKIRFVVTVEASKNMVEPIVVHFLLLLLTMSGTIVRFHASTILLLRSTRELPLRLLLRPVPFELPVMHRIVLHPSWYFPQRLYPSLPRLRAPLHRDSYSFLFLSLSLSHSPSDLFHPR